MVRRILLSISALPFYSLGWLVGQIIKLCHWIRDAFRAGYVKANASFVRIPDMAEFKTEPPVRGDMAQGHEVLWPHFDR